MSNEELWNLDLIEIIKKELNNKYEVEKGKVIKDIFYDEEINKIQLGFMEQDLIIYKSKLNIDLLRNSEFMKIHNNPNGDVIIPLVIIELKYKGVSTYNLCTCSVYASDFKSIFPNCKYLILLRDRNGSSEIKLKRHGRNIDKIFYLSNKSNLTDNYNRGDFKEQLKNDILKNDFNKFICYLKKILEKDIDNSSN
jgi:hypothetical protein